MSHCEDDAVHCENRSEVYIMGLYNKECKRTGIANGDNKSKSIVLKQEGIHE